ncbi:TetR/AcrR family transcriptional regulator [Aquabacter sp. L1I39]|uniref:TetR/AcrR family transcriptional regulator n=1 Tax=Aquabacter sp. L1I39 TaxID=2820278 RepID=UPI001ADC0950|nr:TetR/AcrR family transcriptional regulator [Aquabacter sp. L1I39]QTL04504.1 TetR/AcrR family transcriptional regulator [Aquabacter sp. L1I39]
MARTVHERSDVLPLLGEVFREHGYEGASLSVISARTGLGKGSLYHFFPGGKEEMAQAVLAHIDAWFETEIFAPLRTDPNPDAAIAHMIRGVDAYFRSGNRVCLVGVFALVEARDRFALAVKDYFARWTAALADALTRAGRPADIAFADAEEAVLAIQGALVLARALDDANVFRRAMARIAERLGVAKSP